MARDLTAWADKLERRGSVWGIDSAASAREASTTMGALAAVLRAVAEVLPDVSGHGTSGTSTETLDCSCTDSTNSPEAGDE